jgi:hypothetical protein
MAVQKPKQESQGHEEDSKPNCSLGQNVGSLRSKNGIGEAASKSGAQTFGTGLLHEDKERQKDADEDIDPQKNIDG